MRCSFIYPWILATATLGARFCVVEGFYLSVTVQRTERRRTPCFDTVVEVSDQEVEIPPESDENSYSASDSSTRRDIFKKSMLSASLLLPFAPTIAKAALGTLPELSDTNVVVQGITVRVAEPSQRDAMITFLQNGFGMSILRQRKVGSTVEDIWMGYGPEQLSIPSDWTVPVSSFARYGGHASIRIQYDSQGTTAYYRVGDTSVAGNNFNIAYVQLGVPEYRISQMASSSGTILDAYGFVNVVSPAGLPIRGIVGIWPDPLMLVAIRCTDVEASAQFYAQQLGFSEQPYPYCRPNQGKGVFEPEQPPKSIYMAPTGSNGLGLGILLLPIASGRRKGSQQLTTNPAVQGLTLVYQPSASSTSTDGAASVVDPSGVAITFQSVGDFQATEAASR